MGLARRVARGHVLAARVKTVCWFQKKFVSVHGSLFAVYQASWMLSSQAALR